MEEERISTDIERLASDLNQNIIIYHQSESDHFILPDIERHDFTSGQLQIKTEPKEDHNFGISPTAELLFDDELNSISPKIEQSEFDLGPVISEKEPEIITAEMVFEDHGTTHPQRPFQTSSLANTDSNAHTISRMSTMEQMNTEAELNRIPKRGRPRKVNGRGATMHCCYAFCTNDSRKLGISVESNAYFFIPFPKPCLDYRRQKVSDGHVSSCEQCSKSLKWLKNSQRQDGKFEKLEHVKRQTFVCSQHFFGGKGPTSDHKDPLLANSCTTVKDPLNIHPPTSQSKQHRSTETAILDFQSVKCEVLVNIFESEYCSIMIPNQTDFSKTDDEHCFEVGSNTVKSSNKIESCLHCNETFEGLKELEKHHLKHEKVEITKTDFIDISDLTKEVASKKPHKCRNCGKSFSLRAYLMKHVWEHSREKPHKCHICGKEFHYKSHFERHVKFHKGVKPYTCEYCGSTFTEKNGLKRHSGLHTEHRVHKCAYCEMEFSNKYDLNVHVKIHDAIRHKCSQCEKTFSRRYELKQHILTHLRKFMPVGEEPYKCCFCEKAYYSRHTLMRHLKLHSAEKAPHECNQCGKAFTQKCNLKRHLMFHSGIKPHECIYCRRSFFEKSSLIRHLKFHFGIKEFMCDHCGKGFVLKADRNSHAKTHLQENPVQWNGISSS